MRSSLRTAVILVILTGGFGFSKEQSTQEKFDRILKDAHEYMAFNGTVLVAGNDKVLYENSIGFADKEKQVVLTPKHRFSPGSISKEFTTIAMMMLKDKGQLNYHDTLSKHLPNLPPWADRVSIEHLLTHTSGLGRIKFHPNITTDEVIDQIMAVAQLAYEPGKGYSYGNLNVVLRALIIEKISKKPFGTFVKDHLFDPAGMTNTFSQTNFDSKPPSMVFGEVPTAIAGVTVYTTPSDLLKWEKALWRNVYVRIDTLKEAIVKKGMSGQPGRAYFDFGGFVTNNQGALVKRDHDGTHPSHHAYLANYLDKGTTIILISSDGRKATLFEIEDMIRQTLNHETPRIPATWWLENEIKNKGVLASLSGLRAAVESGKFSFDENMLNSLGYRLSTNDQPEEAITVMKSNLDFFPESANAHDSYADMLIHAKRYTEARAIIERGLMLAKKSNNQFLINSMTGYLKIIKENEQISK